MLENPAAKQGFRRLVQRHLPEIGYGQTIGGLDAKTAPLELERAA